MSTVVYLVLAGVAGGFIGGVRRGRVPYAVPACILAGLIVSVVLSLPLGDQGPHLGEVAIIPAAVGAIGGALLLRVMLERLVPRTC
ncbi:MAG: hypothetical protein AB7R89_18925 [Dehalococcoidia bacterium]